MISRHVAEQFHTDIAKRLCAEISKRDFAKRSCIETLCRDLLQRPRRTLCTQQKLRMRLPDAILAQSSLKKCKRSKPGRPWSLELFPWLRGHQPSLQNPGNAVMASSRSLTAAWQLRNWTPSSLFRPFPVTWRVFYDNPKSLLACFCLELKQISVFPQKKSK